MNIDNNITFTNLKFITYFQIAIILISSLILTNIAGFILYRMQNPSFVIISEVETDFRNSYFSIIDNKIRDLEDLSFLSLKSFNDSPKRIEKNYVRKIIFSFNLKKDFINHFNVKLSDDIKDDLSNYNIFDIKHNISNGSFMLKLEEEDILLADQKINWFMEYVKRNNFKLYAERVSKYLDFLNKNFQLKKLTFNDNEILDDLNNKNLFNNLCNIDEYPDLCDILFKRLLNLENRTIEIDKDFDILISNLGIQKDEFFSTDILYEFRRETFSDNVNLFTAVFLSSLFGIFIFSAIILLFFLIYKIRNNV